MSKKWNPGDKISVDHINDLEKKAEAYERLMAEKRTKTESKKKDEGRDGDS